MKMDNKRLREINRMMKFPGTEEQHDFSDLNVTCCICGEPKGHHSAETLACPREKDLKTGFKTQKEEEIDMERCNGCRPARDTDDSSFGNGALPITNKQCRAIHAIARKTGLIDGYNDRKYKKFLKDNYDAYTCKCLTIDEATDAMTKMVYDDAERKSEQTKRMLEELGNFKRLLFG